MSPEPLGAPAAGQPEPDPSSGEAGGPPPDPPVGPWERARRTVIGTPRDLGDSSLFHKLSLIPLLAWVGLGADGLSSSAYGPEEAFKAIGEHRWIALLLAAATAATVLLISAAYSRLIEDFPAGGGGYAVSTKLLGRGTGLVSGCALIVDYVLTITVSVSAACDALFSFLPAGASNHKVLLAALMILGLTVLNLRGVKDSVIVLAPIFAVFLLTHVFLIGGALFDSAPRVGAVVDGLSESARGSLAALGVLGVFRLFAHSYSLGAGTYTGIEAVSNGLSIMREPRVKTARRTMLYMATSLALTAAGLIVAYLLLAVEHTPGQTLNAVLSGKVAAAYGLGSWFVILTLVSEGALLVVAAQAGFLDGPRVLANMAVDSWFPRRFAALSERLTAQNGILLVGLGALLALVYSNGVVDHLVVMYSINVFVTFSLSTFAMLKLWLGRRGQHRWKRRTLLFASAFLLCATILALTVEEKFAAGGWITILVTGMLIVFCLLVHRHYTQVSQRLARLDEVLAQRPAGGAGPTRAIDPKLPTAVVLVGGYNGVGVHTFLSVVRSFPGYYQNFVFLSVGVVDSGNFKGAGEIEALEAKVQHETQRFVDFAHAHALPAEGCACVATEVARAVEEQAQELGKRFGRLTFFASKLVFPREEWPHRVLHNETAYSVQRRLHALGYTTVVLPVLVQ